MSDDTKSIIHTDTFSVVFTEPIQYERPIIESFGHKLGGFNFFSLGTRGAVFQFFDSVQAPMIEIWFPPPGYYEQQSRTKSAPLDRPLQTKESANRSVGELLALHENRSGLEANRLLEPFIGRWIPPTEGTVRVLTPDGDGAMIVIGLKDSDDVIEAHFRQPWVRELSTHEEGDQLRITGKISHYTGAHLLVLEECEILK
jgi:hypothetical protein